MAGENAYSPGKQDCGGFGLILLLTVSGFSVRLRDVVSRKCAIELHGLSENAVKFRLLLGFRMHRRLAVHLQVQSRMYQPLEITRCDHSRRI